MLLKTHLAFITLFILLFVSHVENRIVFVAATLIATLLPDIDSGLSTLGSNKIMRFFHFFIRHRGFIHSFTLCIVLTIILTLFLPVAALGFFLGYGLHLFLDSFTVEGIMPFWPLRKKSSFNLKTGGRIESILFFSFLILDIFVFLVIVLA